MVSYYADGHTFLLLIIKLLKFNIDFENLKLYQTVKFKNFTHAPNLSMLRLIYWKFFIIVEFDEKKIYLGFENSMNCYSRVIGL